MTQQPRHIEVAASTENLIQVRNFVGEHARRHGFSEKETEQIRLSVDEAMTNVIKHAYDFDSSQKIYVSVGAEDRTFWVAIQDTGRAFDVSAYKVPNVPERIKKRQKGGVGVYLIKQLMDKVEYSTSNQQNEIRMIKNL
ncbi:serine/threonine-protein kinase RsbW [Cyclonatronum proteinivorum]|uniref:Serine/threonine-protein kinase RsbW n=1 Tax=Cyclonatronum proteinivorum TaxID=1457365 RepID=A0A345UHF9_9BACT|nr:ATP-binding protein [Cyclonatronum proteinivorum]AXI99910.1 serine/threonine-protein kinase RsbW [Cyclonatronum proteinivorum]